MAFDPIQEGAKPFDPVAEGATPVVDTPQDNGSGILKTAGGVLDTVSDFLFKRTKDFAGTVYNGIKLNNDLVAFEKNSEDLRNQSRDLISRAKAEVDPVKKMALLQQSRNIDDQISQMSDKLGQSQADLMQAGDIQESDLSKSNLQFAAERGAGVAGEVGALLLPFSSEAKAMMAATKTMNLFAKMAASGVVSAESAALLGITDPKAANLQERVEKGTIDALKAFVTAGLLTGGIEVGKAGLKVGGKILSSILPKDAADRLYASAMNVPSKLAKRLRPIETAGEMSDLGVWGSLDDIQQKSSQVTGDSGILTKVNRSIMAGADMPINTGNAQTAANQELNNAILIEPNQGKKILQHISDIVKPKNKESIGFKQALDAFDAQKELEKIGYFYQNKSTTLSPNPVYEQIGDIYLAAADALGSQIDEATKQQGLIDAFKTPEVIGKLKEISPKLADKFMQAKTVADIRSLQKPFVRMMQMIDLTNQYANSPLVKEIGRSSGIINKVANVVLQSPVVRTGAAQVAGIAQDVGQTVANNLPQLPENTGLLQTLVGMSGR